MNDESEIKLFLIGTRYNIRGLDDQGEAANFCETEQIIIFNGEVASYVQVMICKFCFFF